MLYIYAWAARLGVKMQERAMGAPSRRGFAVLFGLECVMTVVFAVALAIVGAWWAVAVMIGGGVAGWATTRFLGAVPQWVRVVVICAVVAGLIALGVYAQPVIAVGIATMFAYFAGWFLTFLISPVRAQRWRQATAGRARYPESR
ncbi:hypothetical protein GCM10009847_06850 [Leucobacter tardus]|uniref:Uncharacterized protein n=1 Tax=Leucobacter tardus TaxID=501483 RepID=A0A939TJ57_9MICO|nr:hypothetical protein [Leucobacter tardus]MBO2988886.1 hypothetical protein [Leucobacter tardus]